VRYNYSSDMQTILAFLDLAGAATYNDEILQLIGGEFETSVNNGDLLGAGRRPDGRHRARRESLPG
jgi:hypothetical protein